MTKLTAVALLLFALGATGAGWASAQPPASPSQDEFVPVSKLPADEQLPAAPLLVAAYAFAWVALIAYLWSLGRRLSRVERELKAATRTPDDRKRL